jgi:hypothetical protein
MGSKNWVRYYQTISSLCNAGFAKDMKNAASAYRTQCYLGYLVAFASEVKSVEQVASLSPDKEV